MFKITTKDIREGSVVIVRTNFGTGRAVEAVVDYVEEDIKNGRPGFGYDDSWAYLHQVDRVVKY